jgi:hypothetical protein
LGELGSAHTRKSGNQTAEFPEFSVGMGIVGLARATKHIPRVIDVPFLLFWACTKLFLNPAHIQENINKTFIMQDIFED